VISLSTGPNTSWTTSPRRRALRPAQENFRVQTWCWARAARNMHLVISDASGDSAVFEYVDASSSSITASSTGS